MIDEIFDSPSQREPRQELGGALCYSALCLKSLGYDTEIVTRVGEDFPRMYSRILLSEAGIDIEEWRVKGAKTTRYKIDRRGEERRLWLVSKCGDLGFGDFKRAFNEVSRGIPKVLILNPVAGEVSLKLLKRIAKEFERVFVDSQGFTRQFNDTTGEVSMKSGLDISSLAGVDVLKADLDELIAWTGLTNKQAAIDQMSTFVGTILVTSGKGEVELYRQGMLSYKTKPLQVKTKDTTGAGDIMLSAFAARFLETDSLHEALEFATVASSLSVESIGIEKALVSRRQVMEKMKVTTI